MTMKLSAICTLLALLVLALPARADDAAATAPAVAEDTAPIPQATAAQWMDDLMWNRGPIGGPFTLTDPSGRARSDSEFRGKLMVIYFGYTSCPDVCPTDLMAIAQAIDALGPDGDDVQPIFISIDSVRDTPQQIASYVAAFHPRLLGLSGTPEQIRAVATAFKAYYAVGKDPRDGSPVIDHAGVIYLVGRGGDYLGFMPPQTDPARLTDVLRRQLGK
ncbi:MAG: SCO family protein [Xanthobacteraceae bacterium]